MEFGDVGISVEGAAIIAYELSSSSHYTMWSLGLFPHLNAEDKTSRPASLTLQISCKGLEGRGRVQWVTGSTA